MMVMSSCRHNAAGPKRVVDEVQSGTPEGQWVWAAIVTNLCCRVMLMPREADECKFWLNSCVTQAGWDHESQPLAHSEQLDFSLSLSHLLSIFYFFAEYSTSSAEGLGFAENIDGIAKFDQKRKKKKRKKIYIYKIMRKCHRISKFWMTKIKSRVQVITDYSVCEY